MSNRIFLNSGRDETSKYGLNRINWKDVASRMAQVKQAEDRGEQILRFSNDFIDPHLLRVAQDNSAAQDAVQAVRENGSFDVLTPEQASALKSDHNALAELVHTGVVDEDAVHAFLSSPDSDGDAMGDMGGEGDMGGDPMGGDPMGGDGGGMGDVMGGGEPIFASTTASAILERIAKKKGGKCPEHLAKYLFKKKDGKSESEDEGMEEKMEESRPAKGDDKKNGKTEKVETAKASKETVKPEKGKFPEPKLNPLKGFKKMERKGKDEPAAKEATIKSIKADAIHEAEAKGDFERAANIQNHRSERRIKLAQALAELEIDKMRREAKQKKQRTAVAETTTKPVAQPSEVNFVSPKDMNAQERVSFVRKAEALGFPSTYVEEMLGINASTRTANNELVDAIKEIGRSAMSKEIKAVAVQGLLKTADLQQEDAKRIYDYYVNELGYDAEWAKALTTNYKA